MANEEIRHLVRVMNTDLPGDQPVRLALTGIKGIGRRTANIIVKGSGIDPSTKIGYLSDEEIETLNSTINKFENYVPSWMLNRQKDPYSGEDKHLLGQDIFMAIREDVNTLKKTRAYRGIRHERGLKVRGQRTKSTGRGGSTIGVSKKKS
ncbi:MAG: 30S ribosomal protein S13 [Methanohalobium sp.]|uniref:30S ribosomal protein S13 n=1 Tax=Methanohalobium sp. TaxID=2837493 RepID=UPI00397DD849